MPESPQNHGRQIRKETAHDQEGTSRFSALNINAATAKSPCEEIESLIQDHNVEASGGIQGDVLSNFHREIMFGRKEGKKDTLMEHVEFLNIRVEKVAQHRNGSERTFKWGK